MADIDAQLEKDEFKTKVNAFVTAFRAKDGETVGRMRREDPRLEFIFDFIHYFDAAKATPQNVAVMKTIELKTPGIAKAFEAGRLKAMLVGKGRRRTGRGRRARGRRRHTKRR